MDLFGEPGPHGLFGCEKALLRLGYFEESSSGFLIYKDQPLHNPQLSWSIAQSPFHCPKHAVFFTSRAWYGRRRKLRRPPRPAVTLNGLRTAGVERRLTVQPEAIVS
jgi:hypothetical protein